MTTTKATTARDALFTELARKHLFIETMETRYSDRLDFHDVSIWGIQDALEAAFEAGQAAANKPLRKGPRS